MGGNGFAGNELRVLPMPVTQRGLMKLRNQFSIEENREWVELEGGAKLQKKVLCEGKGALASETQPSEREEGLAVLWRRVHTRRVIRCDLMRRPMGAASSCGLTGTSTERATHQA